MHEFSHFEENSTIVKYNNELWFSFIHRCENFFNIIHEDNRKELLQSFDLLRAINSYRSFNTYDELFKAYPDLAHQREYVELLWNHFESMDEEPGHDDLCHKEQTTVILVI